MRRVILAGCLAAFAALAPAAPVAPAAPHPAPDPFAAGKKFAAAGRVDRFVATSAGWTLAADDGELWRPALDLAHRLADEAGRGWPPSSDIYHFLSRDKQFEVRPATDFLVTPRPHRQRDRDDLGNRHGSWPEWVIAPAVVSPRSMRDTLAIARGPVAVTDSLAASLVYAAGDVTIGDRAGSAMVVADGDVSVGSYADTVTIIARGDIRVGKAAVGSVLVAGGTVTVGDDAGDRLQEQFRPVVRERDPNPLGFVTWYELTDAGVDEAAKADGGVVVRKVAAERPFARGGVKPGDVVARVGGHAVATPDDLRRRLRDAHALRAEAALTVRRGGEDLAVRVPLPH